MGGLITVEEYILNKLLINSDDTMKIIRAEIRARRVDLTLSWRRPISYRNQSIDLLRNQFISRIKAKASLSVLSGLRIPISPMKDKTESYCKQIIKSDSLISQTSVGYKCYSCPWKRISPRKWYSIQAAAGNQWRFPR